LKNLVDSGRQEVMDQSATLTNEVQTMIRQTVPPFKRNLCITPPLVQFRRPAENVILEIFNPDFARHGWVHRQGRSCIPIPRALDNTANGRSPGASVRM